MMNRKLVALASLTVILLAGSASDAQAQIGRRGPLTRAWNNWPANALIWSAIRKPSVLIVPSGPHANGLPGTTANGTPVPGSGSQSAATPKATVDLLVVLPVAGATINVNGVDFGKTEYYERKLKVPEAPDGLAHEYKVTASWVANGKAVTQDRTVKVGKTGKATANFLVAD